MQEGRATGVVIESALDKGRGPVATVLVSRGTLKVGDSIVAGDAYGRVRRMVDEHGEDVEEAFPSRPVQVIGFTSVPGAGDNFLVVDEDRIARQIADRRSARKRNALAARSRKRISLEDLDSALKETSQLNLILKGDNSGTVEALEEALMKIEIDDDNNARVTFVVQSDQQLDSNTKGLIRYQNLIGQRYLALMPGQQSGAPLTDGGDIPMYVPGSNPKVRQTEDSFDVSKLLGGFEPLFGALQPDQINALSESLILALQGDNVSLSTFITQAAGVAATLSERDAILGDVVHNLYGPTEAAIDVTAPRRSAAAP